MKQARDITKYSSFYKSIAIFIALALFLMPSLAVAETLSELQRQKEAAAAEAQSARESAQNKQGDANYLSGQLNTLDYQISEAEYSLAITDAKVAETQANINDLNGKIDAKMADIEVEKDKMHEVVSSWYMEGDSTGMMNSVLGSDSLSDLITQQEYYDSIKQQIQLKVEELDKLKAELEVQKAEQDQDMIELKKYQENQEIQKVGLENQTWTKRRLLNDTEDMIDELKDQEASASQKAASLQAKIDQISATKSWGGDIVSSNDGSWYASQLWYPSTYLGSSPYTVAQYGCLITSLAMVAQYYGRGYSVPSAVNASSFNYGGYLLYTPIVSDGGSQSVNWSTIDSELASGHPVVVGVALGIDMGNNYGVSHFVVLKPYSKNGDTYGMHDPLGAGRGYSRNQVKAMRIIR